MLFMNKGIARQVASPVVIIGDRKKIRMETRDETNSVMIVHSTACEAQVDKQYGTKGF